MGTSRELNELYGSMDRFARDYERLGNKVAVLNERLGCRYHCSPANPARLVARLGVVRVTLFGAEVVRLAYWDAPAARSALRDVELCGRALVAARVSGALSPLPAWG